MSAFIMAPSECRVNYPIKDSEEPLSRYLQILFTFSAVFEDMGNSRAEYLRLSIISVNMYENIRVLSPWASNKATWNTITASIRSKIRVNAKYSIGKSKMIKYLEHTWFCLLSIALYSSFIPLCPTNPCLSLGYLIRHVFALLRVQWVLMAPLQPRPS